MRQATFAIVAMALASPLFVPASAGAGEKVQGDMVSPAPAGFFRDFCNVGHIAVPPSPDFAPGISKAKYKFNDQCKGIIILKKMFALPPSDGIPGTGDEIYCLVNFYDSLVTACGSFILRGEVVGPVGSQKTKIKLNGPTQLPGVCPPPPGSIAHVTSVECYVPDFAYSAPIACGAAVGVYTPLVGDPTQGLCFPAGSYVPNSGSPALAIQGVLF